jgi:hypothetical protein
MGDVAVGREILFACAPETAYNEAWGSPTLLGLAVPPPDFEPNIEHLKVKHSDPNPEAHVYDFGQGVRGWTLNVGGKIPKEGMGFPLLSLMGKVTTTGDGPYDHIFAPSLQTPVSLKCLVRTPFRQASPTKGQWHLRGGRVRAAEFVFKPNDFPRFSMELIGGSFSYENLAAAPTILVPAGNYFWSAQEYAANSPHLHNAYGWNIFTIRIENELAADVDESYVVGSDERFRLERAASEEAFRFTITAKRIMDESNADDLEAAYENHTGAGGGANLLVAGVANLSVSSPYTFLTKYKRTPRGQGLVEEEIEAIGYKGATGSQTSIVLTDEEAEPVTQGA